MKVALIFPGQGAQTPNMLHQLPANDLTGNLLEQASLVLQQDVLALDSATALQKSQAVQLCLLIAGVAYAQELQQQGIRVDFVSGLSIGAFPAAVIAGALAFSDAVRLVAYRGWLMDQAYPVGYGLSAIIGLPLAQLESIIAQVNSPVLPVYLANINAEDQWVIAGSDAAMAQVMAMATAAGAAKTQRLAINVPSHCILMTEQAEKLAQAMQQVSIIRPQIAYLSSSTGRVLWQPEQLADDLAWNMARRVRWHDAMLAAYERGVRLAIEMPPGAVLTGLTSKVFETGEVLSRSQLSLQAVCSTVTRSQRNGQEN